MMHRFIVIVLCFYILALVPAPVDANTQASLLERATILWNARVVEDWDTEYQFLPIEETQERTQEAFVALRKTKGPLRYVAAEIGEVVVDGTIGWVAIQYDVQPKAYPSVPPQHIQLWDIWHVRDGQWRLMSREQRALVPKLPAHQRPVEEEAALSTRAQEFLQARESQDWAQVYQYLKPEYRARTPLEQFLSKKTPVSYLGHRLEWTEVIGVSGRAKVALTYQLQEANTPQAGPRETVLVDDWIKVDGQWYRHKP